MLSPHFAAGGSSAQPSLIEVQAAIDDAEQRAGRGEPHLRAAALRPEPTRRASTADATNRVDVALARLHESDAAMAALAEELGQLSSTARSAQGEADRLRQGIRRPKRPGTATSTGLADLEHRLELAGDTVDEPEPDPADRDRLAEQARLARAAEMDARLALRTLEERARALAGRAEALRRAAESERQARVKAMARRERLLPRGADRAAVHAGARVPGRAGREPRWPRPRASGPQAESRADRGGGRHSAPRGPPSGR